MKPLAALPLVAALLVVSQVASAEVHYYLVDSIAEQSTNADLRAEAHELEKIYADMERASGVDAKLDDGFIELASGTTASGFLERCRRIRKKRHPVAGG